MRKKLSEKNPFQLSLPLYSDQIDPKDSGLDKPKELVGVNKFHPLNLKGMISSFLLKIRLK